jgi:membrane protein
MEKKRFSFKELWQVFKNCFSGFSDDKVMKLSASLSYYTVFSMVPLLIVIIFLCGLFFGRDAVEGRIFSQLNGFVGQSSALQLQQIIKATSFSGKNNVAAIIGITTLLIGATSVFAEIQESINMIWGLKPKPKKSWLKMIQNRFLSFSIIISLGFLLIVSLGFSTIIETFSHHLQERFSGIAVIFFYILNILFTFLITGLIFASIFKVLPDAKITWKDVTAGAVLTTVLFMLGKFGISFYIGKQNIGTTYGTAGCLIVMLIWVYYSSLILYFGAEFTKSFAIAFGSEILPAEYAVTTKQVEVDTGKKSIREKEKN